MRLCVNGLPCSNILKNYICVDTYDTSNKFNYTISKSICKYCTHVKNKPSCQHIKNISTYSIYNKNIYKVIYYCNKLKGIY